MDKIGKYELLEKIGTGGFGVVYKGRDPFIKRFVAVKTCSSEDEEMRRRFFREAEIAGNLHHRNVTTVYDFGFQGEVPYLVQEFLSGEDLDQVIKRREHLSDDVKVDYLVQIAAGLEYAHSQGVVHRDIKPGNIRVLDTGRIKIMDFGIAKLTHVESQLTRTGTTLGTSSYLAPEQIKGEDVTSAVDIYSFGVVAYELLTFQRPFEGQTISSLFYKILSHEPEPLQSLWASCSDQLAAVVHGCLAKEPRDRYASMGEVLADLSPIAESARIARADSDRQPTRTIPLPTPEERTTAMPVPPTVDQVADLQKKVEELLHAGNPTAAEIEVTLARKRHGPGSGFDTAVAPLLDQIVRTRKERDDERRRGEKLAALVERSRQLEDEGNLEEALLVLRTARELDEEGAEVPERLEALEARVQEERRLRERTEQAQEVARLLEEGDLDEARAALDELARDAEAGDLLQPLRDRLAALERRRQAAGIADDTRAALAAGRLPEALDLAQRARELDPKDQALKSLIDEVRRAIADEREAERLESQRREAVRQVRAALAAGEAGAARSLLDAAVRELPDEPAWDGLRTEIERLETQRLEERERAWSRAERSVSAALETHDFEGARREVERARIELDDAHRLESLVASIAQAEADDRLERFRHALDGVDAALTAGGLAEARDLLEEARSFDLEDPRLAASTSSLADAERELALTDGLREAGGHLDADELEAAEGALARLEHDHGADQRLATLRQRIEAAVDRREGERLTARLEAAREALGAGDLEAARRELQAAAALDRPSADLAELRAELERSEAERAREAEAERRERGIREATSEIRDLLAAGALRRAEQALRNARSSWGEVADWKTLGERLEELRRANLERQRARREALLRSPALRYGSLAAALAVVVYLAVAFWPEPATREDTLLTGTAVSSEVPAGGEEPVEESVAETPPDGGLEEDAEPATMTVETAIPDVPPDVAPVAADEEPRAEPAETAPPARALQLEERARRALAAGRTDEAMIQALDALSLAPGLADAADVRDRALRAASGSADEASQRAATAGARELAPAEHRRAEERRRQARQAATAGRYLDALRAYDESAELFRGARQAAEEEAARRERDRVAREEAAKPPRPATVDPEPEVEPATTPAPPPPGPSDEQAIQALLASYEAAMESLRFDALRQVYPAVSPALDDALRRYRRLEMDLTACSVSTAGDRGNAHCTMRQVVLPEAGGEQTIQRRVRFEVERASGGWIITNRTFED
jgi:serine/threonine protein kinase